MHQSFHTPRLERGYILVLAIIFFGTFFTVSSAYLNSITASTRSARNDIASAQALSLAEAGIDKAIYQLNQNSSYSGETNTALAPGTFTVTVSTIDNFTKQITATGYIPNNTNPVATKTIKVKAGINNTTVSFHYGVQSGQGGFFMDNSSTITGNVFSGGPVIGTGQNNISGDVVSSGSSGLVYGINASKSVYAHTIGNASESTIVGENAYYVTKTNTTVRGTSNPNSPDHGTAPLPISDAQINEWETIAATGGTAVCSSGSYQISSGSVTIGPIKIPCDFIVSGTSQVTIAGHIWVTGNITIQNSAAIKMAPALGAANVAIIADKPSNQLTSSKIAVKNTATFQNSGTAGSFIFLISQNNSAESGGSETAIDLGNSTATMVAYAAHGLIPLENTVSLKEVTAYKITMRNSANIIYDTGLPSAVFKSGPGGSWTFVPKSYVISQ